MHLPGATLAGTGSSLLVTHPSGPSGIGVVPRALQTQSFWVSLELQRPQQASKEEHPTEPEEGLNPRQPSPQVLHCDRANQVEFLLSFRPMAPRLLCIASALRSFLLSLPSVKAIGTVVRGWSVEPQTGLALVLLSLDVNLKMHMHNMEIITVLTSTGY